MRTAKETDQKKKRRKIFENVEDGPIDTHSVATILGKIQRRKEKPRKSFIGEN